MDDISLNGTINGSQATQANGKPISNGTEIAKISPSQMGPVDKELMRLIGQHLRKMGLERTANVLMEEALLDLDHPSAESFCRHVLSGDFEQADKDILVLKPYIQEIPEIRFLLVEQKYLELLESGNAMAALTCLRSQLTPLAQKVERVHQLSSFHCSLMFMSDPDELRKAANWTGTGVDSRQSLLTKLQAFLPPSIMLPPNRLESLIMQAVEFQRAQCPYHTSRDDPKSLTSVDSLLLDHCCPKQDFPFCPTQVLNDHCDEVWMAKFSPDGHKLATGSKDSAVIIWKVNPDTCTVTKRFLLDGHNYGVVFLAWSPDSTKLILCLHEEASELFIFDADKGVQLAKVSNSSEDSLTCAAWHKDSQKFVCGGVRGQFYLCDLDGRVTETWDGVRVQCLSYMTDGNMALASDTHHRIRGYQLEDGSDCNFIQEEQSIMSFTVDKTGRYALLNVATQGVHLWDLQTKTLVRKYRGLTQGHYTIHSCFGGDNESFMASGSEDSKVYIWHRNTETPIACLTGHNKTVNCVTWNPVYPDMLASVSDDSTVRIWGPAAFHRKKKTNLKKSSTQDVTWQPNLSNGSAL